MPTPARTSLDAIVAAAGEILEADGLPGLTMHRVADAVGVRPPSLYKRVSNRAALVRLISEAAFGELGEALEVAATSGDPTADLRAIAVAFRQFGQARPQAYGLLFGSLPDDWRPEPAVYRRSLDVLLRVVGQLTGPERRLEAARTVTAWAHGFVSMELAGAFRLGGDVDAAFAFGIDRVVAAISEPG
jgi:AcrR family transcriptional regulator